MKLIATQELQVEKGRMQEWKHNFMLEVTREVQTCRCWQCQAARVVQVWRGMVKLEIGVVSNYLY